MDKDTQMKLAYDVHIGSTIKLALEYNAAIVGLSAGWYGNVDSEINEKLFNKEYKRIHDQYEKGLKDASKQLDRSLAQLDTVRWRD